MHSLVRSPGCSGPCGFIDIKISGTCCCALRRDEACPLCWYALVSSAHLFPVFRAAPGILDSPVFPSVSTHYSVYRYKRMTVPPPERLQGDGIPKLRQNIDYNTVGHSLLAETDTTELCGSYGRHAGAPPPLLTSHGPGRKKYHV